MIRKNISGGSPYEPIIGFSRAVRVGNSVFVAGTGPVGADALGVAEQTAQCLTLIATALNQAGSSIEHVYRTRMYLTATEHWREVARAHGEVFAAVRPAATAVIVAGLLDPAWLVEIEAEALLPGDDTRD